MLQMNDSNINFNAMSHDGNGNQFATLGASYSGGQSVYFSVNLDKMDADNVAAIKVDFDTFVDKVIATIIKSKT